MGKDEKKTQNELVVLSKDEMNLAEFPFALLTHRQSEGQATIRFSRPLKVGGRLVKQEWTVTGTEEYGLPIAIDYDVYLALMKLWKDQNFEGNRIHFTRYQLLKLLRWNSSKREYDRLERSLDRLKTVSIKAKWAFWDNKAKKFVTQNVNLFSEYFLYEEKGGKKSEENIPDSYIVVSDALVESVRNGFIRSIDIEKYLAMRTPVTKRLYRFLSKMKYNHYPQFKISLQELADLLPVKDKRPSAIKRVLKRAHTQLIEDFDFLKGVDYREEYDVLKVIYTFSPSETPVKTMMINEADEQQDDEDDFIPEDFTVDQAEAVQRLVESGITQKVAMELAKQFSLEYIKEKLMIYYWMVQNEPHRIKKNPQGFLRKSIEDDYQPPPAYLKYRQKDRKKRMQTNLPLYETENDQKKDPLLERYQVLPPDDQKEILEIAISKLDQFMTNQYQKHGMESLAVKAAIEEHIRKIIEEIEEGETGDDV